MYTLAFSSAELPSFPARSGWPGRQHAIWRKVFATGNLTGCAYKFSTGMGKHIAPLPARESNEGKYCVCVDSKAKFVPIPITSPVRLSFRMGVPARRGNGNAYDAFLIL